MKMMGFKFGADAEDNVLARLVQSFKMHGDSDCPQSENRDDFGILADK